LTLFFADRQKMVVRPSSGPTIGQADIEQAISEPFIYVSDYTKKKIRNLEKRKAKLESYKAKLKSGEAISKDQQTAGMLFQYFEKVLFEYFSQ